MKKIISLLIVLSLVIALCACGDTTNATDPQDLEITTEEPTATEPTATEPILPVLPETNQLEAYITEVNRRLEAMDYTEGDIIRWSHTDAEFYWADKLNIDLFNYGPYSIMYEDPEEGPKIYSITDSGWVYTKFDYLGNVHFPAGNEAQEIIHSTADYAVIMDADNNSVSCWSFGKQLCTHDLPHGAVYVGFSDWVGYLFRNGTDVYTLFDIGAVNFDNGEESCHTKLIARNVLYVIDADYYANSDAWSQPLFHMTDGSVKFYCDWVENPDDLEGCLSEIWYEGGYDK